MTVEKVKPTGTEEVERNSTEAVSGAETTGTPHVQTNAEPSALMEAVVSRDNMERAYQRVVRNKGAAGVDGLGVTELKALLKQHWPSIKAKLLEGRYQPQPVRRVSIPKPNGGGTSPGDPDGAGPADPTSAAPGIEPDL